MHRGGRSQVWLSVVISEYLRRFCVSFPYTPVARPLPHDPRPNLSRENRNWIRNATDQYQVWITIPKIEFKNSNGIYNATSFEIYILFGFYCQRRRLVVDRLRGAVGKPEPRSPQFRLAVCGRFTKWPFV